MNPGRVGRLREISAEAFALVGRQAAEIRAVRAETTGTVLKDLPGWHYGDGIHQSCPREIGAVHPAGDCPTCGPVTVQYVPLLVLPTLWGTRPDGCACCRLRDVDRAWAKILAEPMVWPAPLPGDPELDLRLSAIGMLP